MSEAIGAAAYWVGSAISSLIPAGASSGVVAFGSAAAYAGYAAVYVGLTAAVSYGVSELTKPDSGGIGASQGRELQLQVDPTFPRQMCIGRRLVAGSMVAHYSCGPNRERLHLVIPLVDHPVQQCARVFGDGRLVYNTPLVHGVRTEIPWDDRIGGLVYMTFWDGRPGQTYDSNLVSESAIEPDVVAGRKPGWTTAHVGAGIAWVHIELGYNTNVMTSMPSFLFDIVGAGLYDRRLDSTAGGSGAHRINDPSTWLDEWSDNPATALDHFLLGIKVEDDDLAFGVGLRADDVPYAAMAAAADLSDEDVVTGEGAGAATIKRYRANGVVSASDTFEDVIEALQLQMGARLVDYGGRIGIVPAEERTPVCSLSDGDWVTDDSVSYTDRRTFDDLVGGVEGRFADPNNVYQPTPYEAQLAPEASFADGGEAATRTLELPFEVHPRRAARLARIWLERERRQARLSGTFTFAAWELEPGDWFSYSSTHEQLEDELFEVLDIVKNADFSVTLTAQAVDAGIVAFDNDNDPDLSEPVYLEPVSLWLDTPEFEVEATTLTASGTVEPALLFTLTSDDPLAREIVIERAQWNAGTSEFTGASIFSVHHTDEATTVLRTGILPSTAYKVRCKSRAGARESDWAEWSGAVTTGSSYTVPRAGTADAATGGSALATALAGLGSTDAALDASIAALDTRADALETAAAAADSRLDAVESDLAAAVSDLDADIAAADARLDAAESDLALQGTAIGSLETVTAGQATQISGLQARTTINANLLPNSTGAGGLDGWVNPGAWQVYDHPLWGPWFNRLFTGGSTFTEYFYNEDEIEVFASTQYTVSFSPFLAGLDGGIVTFYIVYYNSGGAYVGEGGNLALTADSTTGARHSATFTTSETTAKVRFAVAMVNAVGDPTYAHVGFWQGKIERGATATVWSDDATLSEARARITTVETTAAANGSAIATLDSRLDAAETGIDGVTEEVSTLTAANLISRMAAVDGGSASAQTLAAVKAELEGDIAGEASARSAAVSSEASARVSGDNAAADRLDELEATVDTPTTGLAARVTTAESAISDLDSTKAEASTVTSLSSTVASQGSALTTAEGEIDALQSDLDAAEATIVTHTADITENASAIADAESAIASLDSRLDAAETDVSGLESTASNLSSRMAAVDGGSASAQTIAQVKAELEGDIAGEASTRAAAVSSLTSADATEASTRAAAVLALEAKTNVRQNLMPYPSGLGNDALASTIGWNVFSAPTPTQPLYMPFYSPAGGAFYYIVWSSGYNSAGAAYIVYEFPNAVAPGQVLTLSLAGNTNLSGATYTLGARNSSHADLGFSSNVAVQLTRNSVSYTMPTGAAYAVLVIQINAQNSAGAYREMYFRDIKLELGSTATAFSDDYLAGNLRARVTVTETAIATLDSAQAAFETSATASIGGLSSSVSSQGSAITTLQGAAAVWEVVAAASGGTPARIGLKTGVGGAEAWIDASNIFHGDNTVFEDAYNSFYTESGGYRFRFGGPFPAAGSMTMWHGPTSVALNSETPANCVFALGLDGKTYKDGAVLGAQATAGHTRGASYSGTPTEGSWWADTSTNILKLYTGGTWYTVSNLANPLVATISDTSVSTSQPQGSNRATGSLTVTVTGGTSPYTYKWRSLSVGGFDLTAETPTAASTFWRGDVVEGNVLFEEWECVVNDANNSFAILRCDVELFDGDWEG